VNSLLAVPGLIFGGGLLAALSHRRTGAAAASAIAGLSAGALLGLYLATGVLRGGASLALHLPWSVPFGSLALGLDPLTAFFLVPILVLPAAAGVYGAAYLREWQGRKNLGASWFLFNTLVACMALVVLARNAVLFLVAWEVMALASYGLVVFEDERAEVRQAGRVYLLATHLGTAALFVFFLLLGRPAGSLDFAAAGFGPESGRVATVAFCLALLGFGTKAGLVPFHVWVPEAHPACPSHVSAVMSGVMIKTGIYGLLRALTLLGPPPAAWGWLTLALGIVSGLYGILLSLAQPDPKRVLAYSSVENIGVIAIGTGVGLLGWTYELPAMSFLGFAGALLHLLNHALTKGLLFLGAGAVLQATHLRSLERMGGLLRRMPWTGALVLLGAAAICGLPPLNGLIGELVIVRAALEGVMQLDGAGAAAGALAIAAIGLIGGLAAAGFTRLAGIALLGEPRSEAAARATEVSRTMRMPMALLALACVAIGLAGPLLVPRMLPVVETVWHGTMVPPFEPGPAVGPLRAWILASGVVLLVLLALVLLRRSLLARRPVPAAVTWDCGYAAPTARMQYTASSYAQPLTRLFGFVLRTRGRADAPSELFPGECAAATETPDPVQERFYRPVFTAIERALAPRRHLQSGQTQLYVLYIALTLLILLVWKLS